MSRCLYGKMVALDMLVSSFVHLWLFELAKFTPSVRAGALDILSADERARSERYAYDPDRDAFIAARAQLRLVLAASAGTTPARLTFASNAYGKPTLVGTAHDLRFNVSHTHDLVVCCVTRQHEIGVDVETLGVPPLEIVERFFSDPEIAAIAALPSDARRRAFYETWTLKEAFIKARGVGLSMPLNTFAVRIDPPGLLPYGDVTTPDRWWLHRVTSVPNHALAICVEGPLLDSPTLTTSWMCPSDIATGCLKVDGPVHVEAERL